jgi:hypothetical protein
MEVENLVEDRLFLRGKPRPMLAEDEHRDAAVVAGFDEEEGAEEPVSGVGEA